jgi:hypothetical protein
MNKNIILVTSILATISIFAGCTEIDERDKFIGSWETTSDFWPFEISFTQQISKFYYENESYDSINFSYEIYNNNILYLYTKPNEYIQQINLTLNYTFSENNNVLTLLNPRVSNYNDSNYIGIYHRID